MGYGGYAPPSGAGTDYGYIGGGMYIPTPYVAPKPVVKPKPAPAPKPVAGGVNYGTPVYHNPKSSASNSSNWKPKPATPAQRQQTAIANGVQIAGVNAPSPKAAATKAVTNVAAKQATGSGGNSSGSAGGGITTDAGGGVEGKASTTLAPPAAAAATPAATPATATPAAPATTRSVVIPDYRIDPAYQIQATNLANQLSDAGTNRTKSEADYDTTYGQTLHNVGWDPSANGGKGTWLGDNPNTQYGAAARSNMEDFGGRGMARSSGYLEGIANMNDLFSNQVGNLNQQRTMFRGAQDDSYNAFQRQTDLMKTQAQMEAVSRIAAMLGVSDNTVRTNPGLTISVPVTGTGGLPK
jgi:hypothetical protein